MRIAVFYAAYEGPRVARCSQLASARQVCV
jgi:hypothetical protein